MFSNIFSPEIKQKVYIIIIFIIKRNVKRICEHMEKGPLLRPFMTDTLLNFYGFGSGLLVRQLGELERKNPVVIRGFNGIGIDAFQVEAALA